MATLAANPVVLLADDSTLYIGTKSPTESSIVAVPKDGSSLARTIFTGQFEPAALAVDTDRIYWTDASAGTVSACPLSGCKADPTILCAGQHSPGRLLVDERNAYWIEFGNPSERSKIVECPLDGCGSSPRVLASQQVLNGRGFAQDASHVYWTTIGGHGKRDAGGPDTEGSVNRIEK